LALTLAIVCGLLVCAGSSAMTMSVSDMLGADVETQGNAFKAFAYSVALADCVLPYLSRMRFDVQGQRFALSLVMVMAEST
jgi:hypothetical protein